MNFNLYRSHNHHRSQDTEHFYHPPMSLGLSLCSHILSLSLLATANLFCHCSFILYLCDLLRLASVVQHVLETHIFQVFCVYIISFNQSFTLIKTCLNFL